MLLHSKILNQNCSISTTNKILNIIKISTKYYSQSHIIRRNNTNLAFNGSSNNDNASTFGKLKFIPNIPNNSNTTSEKPNIDFKFKFINQTNTNGKTLAKQSKWSSHSLPSQEVLTKQRENAILEAKLEKEKLDAAKKIIEEAKANPAPSVQETKTTTTTTTEGKTTSSTLKTKKRKRSLRPRKAIISLSPKAIIHLKALLDKPNPQMIRVGTRNRGCSGTTYDLQYISEPGKFDEIIEQDGVKVVIDSKALFSVVGSEMDWVDEKLQSKFVFKNPNSKGTCGCGESFMV